MKYIKQIIAAMIFLPLVGWLGYMASQIQTLDFESICDKRSKRYTKLCKNVGKRALSQASVLQINNKDYGVIMGVAWRKKGSIISSRNQKKKRYSEKNSYYYIIGDDKGNGQFIRIITEIDPK